MSEMLYRHIIKHIDISKAEFAEVFGYFQPLAVKKKENLVTEGRHCNRFCFVLNGCLRMFYINESGTEQTIQFALENWWVTDIDAFNKGALATFSIQAIEDAEVLFIEKAAMEKMLAESPFMERYFRLVYERAYAASLFRVKYIFSFSKEKFYEHFSSLYPEFIQRVPQKILASFLGLTPEYLSELRKKHSAKKK